MSTVDYHHHSTGPECRWTVFITPYHRRMSKGSQFERAQLVDIGVNFYAAQLASLTSQLLVRARAANVAQFLATGTSAASSRLALGLARANPGTVFATAGIHPHGAKSYDPSTFRELTELWKCPEVVAVGECGLDYNRDFSTPQAQRIAFEQQLSMAVEGFSSWS